MLSTDTSMVYRFLLEFLIHLKFIIIFSMIYFNSNLFSHREIIFKVDYSQLRIQ